MSVSTQNTGQVTPPVGRLRWDLAEPMDEYSSGAEERDGDSTGRAEWTLFQPSCRQPLLLLGKHVFRSEV